MSNAVFPTMKGMTWNVVRKPVFNTKVQTATSGKELRAAFWSYPQWHYSVHFEFLRQYNGNVELETLCGFFLARQGSFDSFLWTDPTDSTVTNQTFALGDGLTTSFTLARTWAGFTEPVAALNGTPSIYRTDWQGTQLLYSTARTNEILQSNTFSDATWQKGITGSTTAPVVTPNFDAAPDGTMTSSRVVFGVVSTIGDISRLEQNYTSVSGVQRVISIWLKSNTGGNQTVGLHQFNGGGALYAAVTPAWKRFYTSFTPGSSTGSVLGLWARGTLSTSAADILVSCSQFELGSIPTPYIPTTTVPVTVTDYSISGPTVTLSAPLDPSASLQWTGSFFYRVRFKQDEAEFNEFMSKLWELQTLEFQSVK